MTRLKSCRRAQLMPLLGDVSRETSPTTAKSSVLRRTSEVVERPRLSLSWLGLVWAPGHVSRETAQTRAARGSVSHRPVQWCGYLHRISPVALQLSGTWMDVSRETHLDGETATRHLVGATPPVDLHGLTRSRTCCFGRGHPGLEAPDGRVRSSPRRGRVSAARLVGAEVSCAVDDVSRETLSP